MLSAVIIAKNEETQIDDVLKTVSFCDEIIIIDNGSTDATREKASPNAKVFQNTVKDFSQLRNFGMENAAGDWILFVDADERVSPELRDNIGKCIQQNTFSAFRIKRRDVMLGQQAYRGELDTMSTLGTIRLMKRDTGLWKGTVHEEFVTTGPVGALEGFLDHYPHKTISEFINEINFYSTLRAKELARQSKKVGLFDIILYPMGKFMYTYFLKRGYADETVGFLYSFMMSFHSFLVRSKLYMMNASSERTHL